MHSALGPIRLVELHDAWVSGIHLRLDGTVEIELGHLAVYHRVASEAEEYDLWSYQARLELRHVHRLDLLGELDEEDTISDDEIVNATGVRLRCEQLIGGAELTRFFLSFAGSGATLSVECRSAQLHLLAPLKLLEKWSGPL